MSDAPGALARLENSGRCGHDRVSIARARDRAAASAPGSGGTVPDAARGILGQRTAPVRGCSCGFMRPAGGVELECAGRSSTFRRSPVVSFRLLWYCAFLTENFVTDKNVADACCPIERRSMPISRGGVQFDVSHGPATPTDAHLSDHSARRGTPRTMRSEQETGRRARVRAAAACRPEEFVA